MVMLSGTLHYLFDFAAGHLSKKKLAHLYDEGQKAMRNNFTFWYGHYPSSIMTYGSSFGLKSIIGKFGDVYLNGHFHSLHGIAPVLYALQSSGMSFCLVLSKAKKKKLLIYDTQTQTCIFTILF